MLIAPVLCVRYDPSRNSIRELGSKDDGDQLDDIFCSREATVEFELPGDECYEVIEHQQ